MVKVGLGMDFCQEKVDLLWSYCLESKELNYRGHSKNCKVRVLFDWNG